MKNIRLALVAAMLLLFAGFKAEAAEIQHLDPPCWWVGMKNTELQIMVHGPEISKSKVEIKYPGVTIKEVVKTENPNYLFIYLNIAPKTRPGEMDIVVKEGKENDEGIKALVKALQSAEVKAFIEKTYEGAVVPLF